MWDDQGGKSWLSWWCLKEIHEMWKLLAPLRFWEQQCCTCWNIFSNSLFQIVYKGKIGEKAWNQKIGFELPFWLLHTNPFYRGFGFTNGFITNLDAWGGRGGGAGLLHADSPKHKPIPIFVPLVHIFLIIGLRTVVVYGQQKIYCLQAFSNPNWSYFSCCLLFSDCSLKLTITQFLTRSNHQFDNDVTLFYVLVKLTM